MRTRLGILVVAGLLLATAVPPTAFGYQELELQAATDAVQAAGRDTVDLLFWRSGFGASMLGGPTLGGNQTAFTSRQTAIENLTGGTTPVGIRPIFLKFGALANASFAAGSVNLSDYATQRWNFTNSSRTTGAATLGTGAASGAAWAAYLLRTNHWVNGTQDPSAPLFGATPADGVLGLWMVEALSDRVSAVTMYGAYNGSALGAFNLSDPALNDNDAGNGWQLVPDALGVTLSTDPEPLFQGFSASNNATSLRGQAALILGLGEIVKLADPAGPRAALFDGDPYDASLYNASLALLRSVVANNDAAHFDAAASTYAAGSGGVDTGDLALLVTALAAAEGAADAAAKPNITAARERALAALTSLSTPFGVFPASYNVSGSTVTGNFSTATLWAQAGALEALSTVYRTTGLQAHYAWMHKASAGLESALYSAGSYHALAPEPALSTFAADAIAVTFGALRDLALTGEEPLAVWRLVNATEWLFSAPPLVLAGATHPAVIGASFVWNATGDTYASGAKDFNSTLSLLAAYEFLTIGPEFLTAVGGGVSITERAALLLHNATASQVGASIDALDVQIAALQAQVAAIQATFDALNANVTAITDRLNLSLENETISGSRIADLQANVTSLRLQLNHTVDNLTQARELLANTSGTYGELQALYNGTNLNLTAALQNATSLAGRLNQTLADIEDIREAMETTNATREGQGKEVSRAQGVVGLAVLGGVLVGAGGLLFLQRYVMTPRVASEQPETEKKGQKGDSRKGKDETEQDDDEDES